MLLGRRNFLSFIVLAMGLAPFLLSCAAQNASSSDGSTTSTQPETSYCSTVSVPTTPVTITGTAVYERRVFSVAQGLGAVDGTTYAIRRAEIRVLSGSSVVQCGETDNSGNFSVAVPQGSSSLVLQVNSRAYNSYAKVSVLNSPSSNQFYSVSSTFTPDVNKSVGTLTATATGTVIGGAFNIYDQILKANEFLRAKTAGCGALCTVFTVAPKVYAYWTLGFNPGTYVGTSSGLSYYLAGKSQLFILGGLNNDPNNTDTDHFDNTVIIHEYGHFIEDQYGKTNSPGGSHNGNAVIDPRLAWGEGWANFFGVAVNAYHTGDTHYRDTNGNASGTVHSYFFNYELDDNPITMDAPTAGVAYLGQGNFREFSVARALWDSVDTDADTLSSTAGYDSNFANDEAIVGNFYEFWAIITQYFPLSTYHFRNFGLFMELQAQLAGATDLSSILTAEQQRANRTDYARVVTAPNGNCTYTLDADFSHSSFATSDQFKDNDFFQYTHAGGALTLILNHTGASDLDLYLYKENYTYGSTSDMISYSNGSGTTETISLSSLSAGTYMINVMNYSGTASNTYTLTKSGVGQLCP